MCHQKFTKNLLERAKPKRKKDENDGQSLRRSKRQRLYVDQTENCIFCLNVSTPEKLHAFTAINA